MRDVIMFTGLVQVPSQLLTSCRVIAPNRSRHFRNSDASAKQAAISTTVTCAALSVSVTSRTFIIFRLYMYIHVMQHDFYLLLLMF